MYQRVILALFLLGCAAPHDNPLDPDSDHYVAPIPEPDLANFVASVHSVHISRIFPTSDSYSVVAEFAGDMSVIIDSVWVSYDGGARVPLSPTGLQSWATIFSSSYFGDVMLGSVVGQPFLFYALDTQNIEYQSSPIYLFRVIESTPLVLEPDSQDVVSGSVTLEWQPFDASFPFGYRPTLVRIFEDFETTVWTSDLLPSAQLTAVVSDSLEDGDYYWTISVIDSFGNSSRSKEGAFSVMASGTH